MVALQLRHYIQKVKLADELITFIGSDGPVKQLVYELN